MSSVTDHQSDTKKSDLQKHVEFFDTDGDGVIWLSDTTRGLHKLGFPFLFAAVFSVVIHLGFTWPSRPVHKIDSRSSYIDIILSIPALLWSFVPDPFLRVWVNNIKRDIHGSDTKSYSVDGHFVPANFESIFADNSTSPNKDSISFWEALIMIWNQRTPYDLYGPAANVAEWFAAWFILAPADGRMKKEDLKSFYDGSGFYTLAAQLKQGKKRGEASPIAKS